MHNCNPQDTHPCNSWCRGHVHVDVAYCDRELLAELGLDPHVTFRNIHAQIHADVYRTPPCAILAMVLVTEAPEMHERYPQYGWVGATVAYRVTYQAHTAPESVCG